MGPRNAWGPQGTAAAAAAARRAPAAVLEPAPVAVERPVAAPAPTPPEPALTEPLSPPLSAEHLQALTCLGEEERAMFHQLHRQVADEAQEGGPRTRYSILRNFMDMTTEQLETCIDLYTQQEAAKVAAAAQIIKQGAEVRPVEEPTAPDAAEESAAGDGVPVPAAAAAAQEPVARPSEPEGRVPSAASSAPAAPRLVPQVPVVPDAGPTAPKEWPTLGGPPGLPSSATPAKAWGPQARRQPPPQQPAQPPAQEPQAQAEPRQPAQQPAPEPATSAEPTPNPAEAVTAEAAAPVWSLGPMPSIAPPLPPGAAQPPASAPAAPVATAVPAAAAAAQPTPPAAPGGHSPSGAHLATGGPAAGSGKALAVAASVMPPGLGMAMPPGLQSLGTAAATPEVAPPAAPPVAPPPVAAAPPSEASSETSSKAAAPPPPPPAAAKPDTPGQGPEDWIRKRLYKVGAQVEATPGVLASVLSNLTAEQMVPPFTEVKLWLGLDETQGMSPALEQIVTEYRKLFCTR
mmetsp:Transcript_109480/g.244311  ORF Transcript_109480/g.244311 Transcript_109480/m.244311 type:complete len:516 (-) Transcript_109480:71-1618(-)